MKKTRRQSFLVAASFLVGVAIITVTSQYSADHFKGQRRQNVHLMSEPAAVARMQIGWASGDER